MNVEKLTPAPWVADLMHGLHQVRCSRYAGVAGHPFKAKGFSGFDGEKSVELIDGFKEVPYSDEDCEFIALARNAFDVLMRRGWNCYQLDDGWYVEDGGNKGENPGKILCAIRQRDGTNEILHWPDPFTALVEADKWFKENVEATA